MTVKPCVKCGGVKRYKNGDCAACAKARESARYQRERDRIDAVHTAWRKANPEKHNALSAKWASENPIKQKARVAVWSAENRERRGVSARASYLRNKDAVRVRGAAWIKANPHKAVERTSRRAASKLQATPAWANEFFISEAYHLAKVRERMCGGKWHVDHIVPLRSKLVCGLHVEHNLQVIPESVNLAKSNRYWPDQP